MVPVKGSNCFRLEEQRETYDRAAKSHMSTPSLSLYFIGIRLYCQKSALRRMSFYEYGDSELKKEQLRKNIIYVYQ